MLFNLAEHRYILLPVRRGRGIVEPEVHHAHAADAGECLPARPQYLLCSYFKLKGERLIKF